jgi:hypothetical protein
VNTGPHIAHIAHNPGARAIVRVLRNVRATGDICCSSCDHVNTETKETN